MSSKSINMLTNLKTVELSLVRRGANNKRIALTKEKEMSLNDLFETLLETEAEGESELVASLKTEKVGEEALEIAKAHYRLQHGFKDKLAPEAFAEVAKAAGYAVEKTEKREDEGDDKLPAFLRDKKKKKKEEDEMKKLSPEIEELMKSQQSELEAVRKELNQERSQRVRKEFVVKCEEQYSHVPGMTAEEMGEMLQKAYGFDSAHGEMLEKQWGAMDSAVKKGALLKSTGRIGRDVEGSSASKLEGVAKGYQSTDSALSYEKAYLKAVTDRPDLYNEYLQENPAQRSQFA